MKTKTGKTIYSIFIALIIFISVSFVYLILNSNENFSLNDGVVYDYSEKWSIEIDDNIIEVNNLPYVSGATSDDTIILRKKLPASIKEIDCLAIRSQRQDLYVFINGILRSSYTDKNYRIHGNTSTSGYLFVPLFESDSKQEVCIKAITSNNRYKGHFDKVYIGSSIGIYSKILRDNILGVFIACVTVVLGIICIFGYFITKKYFSDVYTLGLVGWFAILEGLYCLSQSRMRQLYTGNITFVGDFGYQLLLLLPIPVILSFDYFQKHRYSKIYNVFSLLYIVDFVGQNIVVGLNIKDYIEIQVSFQILTLIAILTILICAAIDIKKGLIKEIKAPLIGFLGITVSGVFEIVNVWFVLNINNGNSLTIGMLFYISIIAYTALDDILLQENRKKDAIAANIAKSQFLAAMSHEIRTPINAVLGMNEMILRESDDETIKSYAGDIASAGKSLISLVNDILDFSKIEAGKYEIVNVEYNIKYLLRDLINMVKIRAQKKDLTLEIDIDPQLHNVYWGDEVRIKQIVSNLLTNAVKYTDKGCVRFSVKLKDIHTGYATLKFAVKDTGIGMKPEDVERIGSSFLRFDTNRNKNIEGTGLGLAICSQLLSLMDSQLHVSSEYGMGSIFSFEIVQKIVDVAPIGDINSYMTSVCEKSKHTEFCAWDARVLVVDDNEINISVIKGLLKRTGMRIDSALSGKEAINLCKNHFYHVILMDHMMPNMDGIEAVHILRDENIVNINKTNIIALTANAVSGAREMYLSEGFSDYMTKPVEIGELYQCLLNHLPPELVTIGVSDSPDNMTSDSVEPFDVLSSEHIDGMIGLKFCENNIDDYHSVLRMYYDKGVKDLSDIENYPERLFLVDDCKDYALLAHSLKSSSKIIGAICLADMCSDIEAAAKDNNIVEIRRLEPYAHLLYKNIINEILMYLERGTEHKIDISQPENAKYKGDERQMLQKAVLALEDFDYDSALDILNDMLNKTE